MSDRPVLQEFSVERMFRPMEEVKRRLAKAAAALDQAGVHYAVIGGNAVAAWVTQWDEGGARNTLDVDLLLRREDLPQATAAMQEAGFVLRRAMGITMFLDGPGAKARDAVHILFAEEKVREEYLIPAPSVLESQLLGSLRVLNLEALVRMKLTSYRLKDQVHLLDMIQLGMIDSSWPTRLPESLRSRLQGLLENPEARE